MRLLARPLMNPLPYQPGFQRTTTGDDVKKLQAEMQQARNQQFLLGTGALTVFALSSWLMPRSIPNETTYPSAVSAAASIALLALLWLMLRWTRTLWEVIVIISRYLELRGDSEWEGDFRHFHTKNSTFSYNSQSRAVSSIYMLLGLLIPANYFSVALLTGTVAFSSPDWAVLSASLLYLVVALFYAFGPRRESAIEDRWREILALRHPLPKDTTNEPANA